MTKLTLHSQGIDDYFPRFLELSGATHFKGVGAFPSYPGVTTIGRVYFEQAEVNSLVAMGSYGADIMFDAIWPEVSKAPQVGIWETPANEPSIWEAHVANGYITFSQRMTQRFHNAGKKVIAGAINTGWPSLPKDDGGIMMDMVLEACQGADGLSLHEYGRYDMRVDATYECLRYRRLHTYAGGDHPPFYITECGLDQQPGPDFGHKGWRIILDENEDAYIEQLLWYEQQLRQDDYVVCATVFTAKPSGWPSFDVYEGVAMKLAGELANLGPGPIPPDPPDPPDPPNGGDMEIRIFDASGQPRDEAWLQENYGPVTVEGSGFAVAEFHERVNTYAAIVVILLDESGAPIPGQVVQFSWPDGTVQGVTNEEGKVGFDMGGGAYYEPPNKGPHWINSREVKVDGLGMIWATNHDHLDVTLREGPPPDPDPDPDPDPPTDDRALGIDVSDHQGVIDWQAVADSGVTFAFIRASVCRKDAVVEDGRFRENWDGAGAHGLLRGVYHYIGVEHRGQAAFFVDTVGERVPELGWWGDAEHDELTEERCGEFFYAVDRNLAGRGTSDVYSRASYLDWWYPISWAEGKDIWVADHTGAEEPAIPKDWDTWEFWQYTSDGSVPGIAGRVDMNRYKGTVQDLFDKYGGDVPPPDPDPDPPDDCCEQLVALMDEIIDLLEVIAG